jgi:hypothetical protein
VQHGTVQVTNQEICLWDNFRPVKHEYITVQIINSDTIIPFYHFMLNSHDSFSTTGMQPGTKREFQDERCLFKEMIL